MEITASKVKKILNKDSCWDGWIFDKETGRPLIFKKIKVVDRIFKGTN